MSGTTWQVGATSVSTFWRAFDSATGEDYAGTAFTHTTPGLRAGYYRPGAAAAVEAVVGDLPAPVALANPAAAYTEWGFVHVAGPYYRLDLPNAAFATGVPHVLRWITGVTGVTFAPATLDELSGSDPRAVRPTLNVAGGRVEANLKQVNDVTVIGAGVEGDFWRPSA